MINSNYLNVRIVNIINNYVSISNNLGARGKKNCVGISGKLLST